MITAKNHALRIGRPVCVAHTLHPAREATRPARRPEHRQARRAGLTDLRGAVLSTALERLIDHAWLELAIES